MPRPTRWGAWPVIAALASAVLPTGGTAAELRGVVVSRETGEALPHAQVRVLGASRVFESAPDGSFRIPDLPAGTWRLGISIVGYLAKLDSITVSDSGSLLVRRFALEPHVIPMGEVVVRPSTPGAEAHAQRMSHEEIRRIPATAEDVFRAVQTLPGTAAPDFTASFLLRGGESDETIVRFDDVDLLEPYHIRDWGGMISVVSLNAVGAARLQRGGLPARYGRQLSGALEIQSPLERPSRLGLQLGAGISQVRAAVDGPLGSGGSFLLSARHGLLSALYRLHRFVPDTYIQPDFQDVLALARVPTGARQELTLLALAVHDRLRYDESFDEADISGRGRNLTLGARWTASPSSRVRERAVLSADVFDRHSVLGHTGQDDAITRAVRGRLEGELALTGRHLLEAGIAGEWEDLRGGLRAIDAQIRNGEYDEQVALAAEGTAVRRRLELFGSVQSRVLDQVSTTLGINVARDAYRWGLRVNGETPRTEPGGWFAAPRISAAARLGGGLTARAAAGLLAQPTFLNNLGEERLLLPLGRRREAREAVAGLDGTLGRFRFRVEGYHRSERGAAFPIQDLAVRPELSTPLDRGRSRGVELFAQTPGWKLADAWIGYALSRASWETPEGDVPRSFDQRHAVSASLNVRPVGKWNWNATVRYHTGSPYTRRDWASPDGRYYWSPVYGPFMGAVYPDYFRLDLRLTHAIPIGRPGGYFYAELINVTAHENVYLYAAEFEGQAGGGYQPRRKVIPLFPRLPSAGFEVRF